MAAPTQMCAPNGSLKTQLVVTKFKLLLPPGSPGRTDPSTPRLLASLVQTRAQLLTGVRVHSKYQRNVVAVGSVLPARGSGGAGPGGAPHVSSLLLHSPSAPGWLVCPSVWGYCEQGAHRRFL